MHRFFHIFSLNVPAYGLFMAIGLCTACALAVRRVKKAGGDANDMIAIIAVAFGCALLGGNALYLAVSYGFDRVLADIRNGDFSFITEGGIVFYGALLGGIAGFFLGLAITKEKRLNMLCNAVVPCIPLGHGFGRIGCLFAGCCYGVPYDGPCSVRLPDAGIDYPVFPIQALESLLNFLLCGVLLLWSKRKPAGCTLLYLYFLFYGSARFVLEFFRGDAIRGVSGGLSTSQWISLALVLFSVGMLTAARLGRSRSE